MGDHWSPERLLDEEITRRQTLARFGVGAAAAVGLSALGMACGDDDNQAAARGGVLRFARNEEPLSFDPAVPTDNGSIWVIYNIFDQLTTVNKDSTDVVPSLADSWDVSSDAKTYMFKLRDAEFSDGTPVTAEDVVFSLERAKKGGYGFLFAPVTRLRAVDRRTVQVDLEHPFAPLLQNLNVFPASIVPKAKVEADPKGFASRPIGTGPFALKQFRKGQRTDLVRNRNYWKSGKPHLDEVILPYVSDDNTRILKLQAGEVQAAANIPYAQIDQLNQQSEIDVLVEPLFRFDGIWLNNAQKPLDNVSVRQALNYATDKESIVKTVLFDKADVANHMMPKMKYWQSDIDPYPYDIERAKHLIRAAGGSFNLPVVVPTGDAIISQVAQIVKESWAQIGVGVQIRNLDGGTAYTEFSQGNYTAGSNWYITSDVTAPDELAALQFDYWALGGTHSFFSNYKSRRAQSLISDAARSTDEDQRARLFGDLQQLVMEDAPLVALYFGPARTGVRTNVKDFRTVKTAWWRLEDVALLES